MEDDYIYDRARERFGALAFLILAAFAFWAIGGKSFDTQLFPRLVSGLIMVGSAVVLLRSFLRAAPAPAPSAIDAAVEAGQAEAGVGKARNGLAEGILVAIGFGMAVLYVLGVHYVGFLISTSVFIPLSALVFGYRNWLAILLTTVGFVAFTTFLFRYVFYILLPEPLLRLY